MEAIVTTFEDYLTLPSYQRPDKASPKSIVADIEAARTLRQWLLDQGAVIELIVTGDRAIQFLKAAASAPFLGADLETMPATRPPHTNASENDIRAFVTKRKISGGTVSDKGRDARDIMLGLAKTCMKLKVSFYDFIGDRLGVKGSKIPPLASLVRPAPA